MTNLPYTFNEEDNYTYTFFDDDWKEIGDTPLYLHASYNGLPATLPIWFKKKEEVINPGKDIIEEANPTGSFPAGISDDAFAILYHMDEDLNFASVDTTTNDDDVAAQKGKITLNSYAERLNAAARLYMQHYNNYNEGEDITITEETKYYGVDDNGIYVLIPYTSDIYENEITADNTCYKVYIGGECEVVDTDEDILGNDANLLYANGYYYPLVKEGNSKPTLYLFINTQIRMILLDSTLTPTKYGYADEDIVNPLITDTKEIEDKIYHLYDSTGNYLKLPASGNVNTYSIDEDGNPNAMINSGTTRLLILPSMVKSISCLYSGGNMDNGIIINPFLEEIGDYAFYGTGLSGNIIMDEVLGATTGLKTIGKCAFKNASNFHLFYDEETNNTILPKSLIAIKEEAFCNIPLHGAVMNISECENLETVEARAFAGIHNWTGFTYKKTQVEDDNSEDTCLIYLPPECMYLSQQRNLGSLKNPDARTITGWADSSYTSDLYDQAMDLESNITNNEKTKGEEHATFKEAQFNGFTWNCVE